MSEAALPHSQSIRFLISRVLHYSKLISELLHKFKSVLFLLSSSIFLHLKQFCPSAPHTDKFCFQCVILFAYQNYLNINATGKSITVVLISSSFKNFSIPKSYCMHMSCLYVYNLQFMKLHEHRKKELF